MIGIYKITSPSYKIYIGQSINIEKRFVHYSFIDCKSQIRLYNSFKKYGIENHIFEIIEECDIELLNERERYYQDLFDVLSKNGLNCKLTRTDDKSGKHSEETKLKIGLGNKGKIRSEKCKENLRTKRHSVETKIKISIAGKNRFCSDETKIKRSLSLKGLERTSLQKETMSKSKLGINCKQIVNINTGEIYNGVKECCLLNNLNIKTMYTKLSGGRKNNTFFKYII